jgi:hypothetical protein
MSGAGDNRPHRNLGTFEIQERIRNLKKWIRDDEREMRRLQGYGATDEVEGKRLTIQMHQREIDAFYKELAIREGRGDRPGLVTVACSCQHPRQFKLPGKVYDRGPITCGNCNKPFKLT